MGAGNECGFVVLWKFIKEICLKYCTLLFTAVLSLILLYLFDCYGSQDCKVLCCIVNKLSEANLTILGIDIAALAILFALFQDKNIDPNAKKAFKEQSMSFLSNSALQLIAFLLSLVHIIIPLRIVIFFQLWAMILVFDLILELYMLRSAITNR